MQLFPTTCMFPIFHSSNIHYAAFPLRPLTPLSGQLSSNATAKPEIVEVEKNECTFVEVGYLSNAHGLRGEICVKPSTDFLELRFATPGRRWLRQSAASKGTVKEVDLLEGREHPAQKSWILKFEGVDSVEQAKQLVGSTMLVREDDRPELEEEEYYSRDLIGMQVILKETDECIGAVVNVFDNRGTDLLQVMLLPSITGSDSSQNSIPVTSPRLVWIPFVEAIVPDVDINKRELKITPPKGLLELNMRADERSKKERRKLEWREKKRMQRRLILAKKKLIELDQKHVFDGLRHGEKSQKSFLADQIVGINLKLLQLALQEVKSPPSQRSKSYDLPAAARSDQVKRFLKIPAKNFTQNSCKELLGSNFKYADQGLNLLARGKVAKVVILDSHGKENDWLIAFFEKICSDEQMTSKSEGQISVPLILICGEQELQPLKLLFVENDYFGFQLEKVQFMTEEKLPVVTFLEQNEDCHKITMTSPWEILQSPIGSGGVIASLSSSSSALQEFCDAGIEYIQVLRPIDDHIDGTSAVLLGVTASSEAEMGLIRLPGRKTDTEENLNIVFSMNFIMRLCKTENLALEVVRRRSMDSSDITKLYEFRCSLLSAALRASSGNFCVLQLTE